MELPEIAEVGRNLAVMVRIQGPDPKGLKMRRHVFHLHQTGYTTLSASGLLLPPSLGDSLAFLGGLHHQGAIVVTTASIVEPFLPVQHRTGDNPSTQVHFKVPYPKLIPGAQIDVLVEGGKTSDYCGKPDAAPTWLQAQPLALVSVSTSSAALQLLVGNHGNSPESGSWEVGWSLAPLNDSTHSSLDDIQEEVGLIENRSRPGDEWNFTSNKPFNLSQMAISTTRIAFLIVFAVDPKNLLHISLSQTQKRGDILLVTGSPFGVLSPLHFFNSVSMGAVANCCPPGSYSSSLLMADIRCLPGMEGGPVFDEEAGLVGILTRPLRQKDCSTEIQLVITWDAIATACGELRKECHTADGNKHNESFSSLWEGSLTNIYSHRRPFQHVSKHPGSHVISESSFEKAIASIVLVTIGDEAWASGILLNKHGLILTNAHLLEPWRFSKTSFLSSANGKKVSSVTPRRPVNWDDQNSGHEVNQILWHSLIKISDTVGDDLKASSSGSSYKSYKRIRVRLNHKEPRIWFDAKVVYISNGPLDIAMLQLELVPDELCAITPDFVCPSPGSKVHVIGHGLFGPQSDVYPYVSSGVVAKVVRTPSLLLVSESEGSRCLPLMLETTAAVYPGMSGGAVVNSDGQMIGLVTSNAKYAGGTTIPHLNFSIPCVALEPIFKFAGQEHELSILQSLDIPDLFLSSVWALMSSPSPPLQALLDKKNEGKGSRFAKFLAEKHIEVTLPKDQNPSVRGKFSKNMLLRSKL